MILIALATLAVAGFALKRYPAGRQLYAVGSNPDGAALIGIRSTLLVLAAFAISGLLAGFDGALWASRYATVGVFVAAFATGVRVAVTGAAPSVFRFAQMEAAHPSRNTWLSTPPTPASQSNAGATRPGLAPT